MTPAQGELRDACHVIEGWCASHQAPVGHRERLEGEPGADPADRPMASDEAAEAQYAGTLPREAAATEHNRRAGLAVAERDTGELAQLRAEAAAVGALRNAAQVFLVRGKCLRCDSAVSRGVEQGGAYATVTEWRHEEDGRDAQHPVTNVLPPTGTV